MAQKLVEFIGAQPGAPGSPFVTPWILPHPRRASMWQMPISALLPQFTFPDSGYGSKQLIGQTSPVIGLVTKPWYALPSSDSPTICPCELMPRANVPLAPG